MTPSTSEEARPPARVALTDQPLFIGGEFVAGAAGRTFAAVNPATGEELCRVAEAGPEDIDRAVRAACRALEDGPWGRMDAAERGRLIYRLADLTEQYAEDLAVVESLNGGKVLREPREGVQGVVDTLRYYAGWADKIEGRTVPVRGGYLSYTVRQSVGVVGQIIPWNYPLLMLGMKWGPALAWSCTIVMKLVEQTPLSGMHMAELGRAAGIPDGVINVVNGFGRSAGAALVGHTDVNKVSFTGSTETGKAIQKAAADTLKRCTFELGGKNPNVVFADADLDVAVDGAVYAGFYNAGQAYTAGSRLYVEARIHAEFVRRLADKARQRKLGDPLAPDTDQGPQVSRDQMDKILGYVDDARKEGAELVAGGRRFGDRGFFDADGMTIAREEVFGPVVAVLPFSGLDEVVRRANASVYGLAAAVWTRDIDKALRFARAAQAGTIWVNCYHMVDTTTPFGGCKMSGLGRENGAAALDHYTETKTITIKVG